MHERRDGSTLALEVLGARRGLSLPLTLGRMM